MLYAANTSKMVNVMNKLLETVVSILKDDVDIEILEMHDQWKKDVPSGTSREMGEIMANGPWGKERLAILLYMEERRGESPRVPGTIGYHSLRAGNIPSSHTVFFGGMGERLEITHHSYNWECFARGACDCAAYLADKPAGFYTIQDVLGFKEGRLIKVCLLKSYTFITILYSFHPSASAQAFDAFVQFMGGQIGGNTFGNQVCPLLIRGDAASDPGGGHTFFS